MLQACINVQYKHVYNINTSLARYTLHPGASLLDGMHVYTRLLLGSTYTVSNPMSPCSSLIIKATVDSTFRPIGPVSMITFSCINRRHRFSCVV